jgi:hypothetical protein
MPVQKPTIIMKKILKLCLVLLLFYAPLKTKAQCDSLVITDIPCDSVIAAINGLSQYTISGTDTPYSVPFAVAYLEICYPEYNADSIDLAALLHCCHPAGINYNDSTLSYCETAIYFRLLLQYALPHRSCLPSWTYNYLISFLLPQIPVLAADSNISLLCKDVNTCNVNCVSVCDDTIISSCDSINSVNFVYTHILADEGLNIDTNLLVNVYTTLYGYAPPYNTIISQISNCNPDDTAIFTEITYTAANPVYSLDSFGHYYLDFDLLATDTPNNLLFSQGLIYINYDTTIFGSNMVSRGVITATRGIDSFYNLSLSDSAPNLLKLSIAHDSTNNLTNLDSIHTNRELCHLKINLTSLSTPAVKAAFDTLAMAGHSMYRQTPTGLEFPYDIIRVDGLVGTPLATELDLDIESVVVSGSPYPTYLDFDVNGYSQVNNIVSTAYLVNYSVALFFDPNIFDSVTFINYQSLGDDGSNPGGTGGTGVNGGNAIYGFSGTVSGDTMVIALTDSPNFDPTNIYQIFDVLDISPLAHVRMHIANCDNIPNVYIDPSSSSAHWWDATTQRSEKYTPVDTDNASYGNNGDPMCVYPPHIANWSPTCTNAGSFEVTTINGAYFGGSPGTVYFTSANNPDSFISTIPQDIISWSDGQIQLLVPSMPENNEVAGSGQFYVKTAGGTMDSYAENSQMSIGYANYNRRNVSVSSTNPDFMKAMLTYFLDSPFVFQMDSAMFNNTDAVNTIQSVMATINCYTGLRFALNTTTPALIDTTAIDNIHLIRLKPYSPLTFTDSTVLAFTDFTHRFQSCNHGLSQYNDWADYLSDADITVNATPLIGHTWLWRDTMPSNTQVSFATDILHELCHAALLCHTQPQSGLNVMYPVVNVGNYYPDFSGDPDDALGIIHMLSLGRTIGASGSFYICPSPLTPTTCSTRIGTTNGIEDIPDNGSSFMASLYPNPYEGTTVVHIEVSGYANFSIIVYDLVGHIVRQINIASTVSFDVPLSGFEESAGIYLIQVSDLHNRQVL